MQREDVKTSIRISPPVSRTTPSTTPSPVSNGSPLLALSNSHIEAVIQMATASAPDGPIPGRDTRTQLFVGNLPYRVRWQDLKDLFRKAGTILRADVSLGPDNRSRGYGTVLFATREDASRAVEMFNGYNWQTRILEVRLDRVPPSDLDLSPLSPNINLSTVSNLATPFPVYGNPDRSTFAPGMDDFQIADNIGRPSSNVMTRNLFVGNLPFHCQWQDLKDLFRQAGTIIRADVALGPDGRSRGFGTVSFANDTDAERAVNIFNGYDYNGRILKVHYDKFAQSQAILSQAQSPLLRLTSPNPSQAFQSQTLSSRLDSSMDSHTLMPIPAPLSALERALSLSRHQTPSPFHHPVTAPLYHDIYSVSDTLDNDAMDVQSGASIAPLLLTHALSASLNQAPQLTSSSHQSPFGELDSSPKSDQVAGSSFIHSHLSRSNALSSPLPSGEDGASSFASRKCGPPPPVPLSTKPSLISSTAPQGLKSEELLASTRNTSTPLSSSPVTAIGRSISTPPPTISIPPTASANVPFSPTDSELVAPAVTAVAQTTDEEIIHKSKIRSRPRLNSSHPHPHPGPITLPSPSMPPFHSGPGVPVSPFQGLPPITPSMPTFTFVPQNATPPLNPHFLSPGVGLTPFSPPAPMSPGSYYHPNHRFHPMPWNPAPGAPIHHPHSHSPVYAMHGHSPLHSPTYFASQPAVMHGPPGPPTDYFSVPPMSMAADGYFPPVQYQSVRTSEASGNDFGLGFDSKSDRPPSGDSVPTRSDNSFSEDGESQSQRLSRNSSEASSWHDSPEKLHSIAEELGRFSIGARDLKIADDSKAEQSTNEAPTLPCGPQRTHSDEANLPTSSSLANNLRSEMRNEISDSGIEDGASLLPVHTPGERRASWTPSATRSVFRRELMDSAVGIAS